ncbi:MAG: response regulator transcription factor [bacterium]|nr:response regulator transcription factor [Candidatus Colisoma equi]
MKQNRDPIRIIFADDHQIVREGLARLIDREKDLKIVAEADNGRDAVRLTKELKPDLTVLDLKMPIMDGTAAASAILREDPNARILILTSFTTDAEVKDALDAGVLSAIVKDCSSETLIDALRRTAHGESIVSREIADNLTKQRQTPTLSPRQLEILRLVAKGFNNDEIAERIGLSRGGVKAHLAIAFDRLGAYSRAEAASLAVSLGII